jgi:hypothetical protein
MIQRCKRWGGLRMPSSRLTRIRFAALSLAVTLTGPTYAGTITTFFNSDPGVAPPGPFPNSTAEQTTFIAAATAHGDRVNTHGLGNQTVGSLNGLWLNGDGTFVVTGAFSAGQNGITNTQTGNANDPFNVTGGSNNFIAIGPGNSITFNMNDPINAFGSFFTGLDGSILHITFNDGAVETVTVPTTPNGGAEYFGFLDTSTFTSFTVEDLSSDNFGMDGISFGFPVPVPAPLIGRGLPVLLAVGGLLFGAKLLDRRKKHGSQFG